MSPLQLAGLDGSNPLAFLAALGVLVAIDEPGATDRRPRLHWSLEGVWRPALTSVLPDADALVAKLDADRCALENEPALRFEYNRAGKKIADVKPSPEELHDTLLRLAEASAPDRRSSIDWITAFVSEGALDGRGAAKPSSLHFTAGNQRFLKAALELQAGTSADHLRTALLGPWTYDATLPVMGWDNTETRDYALRATNPSGDKKTGNPGADWLALRGLLMLPTAARGQRQHTAGVKGRWKDSTFTWPLWTIPCTLDEIRALLLLRDLPTQSERARMGIGQMFQSTILRSDQGGYGSVTPAKAL